MSFDTVSDIPAIKDKLNHGEKVRYNMSRVSQKYKGLLGKCFITHKKEETLFVLENGSF
jgi:hypothetical protein